MAVITGTEGDDLLLGTLRRDVISGLGGADQLLGLDGDDDLDGGEGDDVLHGGAGNDQLSDFFGSNNLVGGSGDDALSAGDGNDILQGDAGSDVLLGGLGNDIVNGGDDNDQIDGGAAMTSSTAGSATMCFLEAARTTACPAMLATISPPATSCSPERPHAVRGHRALHRHRRAAAGRARRRGLQKPLLVKGEPGTGKTMLAEEVAERARHAALSLAHQVDHQGAAGALRVRCGLAAARQPARRSAGPGHPALHPPGRALAGVRQRASGRSC